MSHVASVDLKITDLDALRTVCDRLGLELVEGQTSYKWYGKFMNDWNDAQRAAALKGHNPATFGQSVHAIRRKDRNSAAYEIGLVARLDGQPGFEAVYDSWGAGGGLIEHLAGKGLSTLKTELSTEVTMRHLMRAGYRVSTQEKAKVNN